MIIFYLVTLFIIISLLYIYRVYKDWKIITNVLMEIQRLLDEHEYDIALGMVKTLDYVYPTYVMNIISKQTYQSLKYQIYMKETEI